jgi:ketosteroid isomerase-like protein
MMERAMHIHILRLFAPALSLLLGISPIALGDEAADRAALEAATQAWIKAFNARDADALAALTTEDVVLLDPTLPPVSGREAARGAWQQALGAAKGQVTNATKEAVIAGDVAWRIGALAHKLPNGEVVSRGQSLEIWKRVNGQWKIHRQMSSTILAQPKLLPRPIPSEPVLDTPGG